jgi:transcriptional regulator with GAF, ATPase, and Fis domain
MVREQGPGHLGRTCPGSPRHDRTQGLAWPRNVRKLEHAVQRAAVRAGRRIGAADLGLDVDGGRVAEDSVPYRAGTRSTTTGFFTRSANTRVGEFGGRLAARHQPHDALATTHQAVAREVSAWHRRGGCRGQ